MTRLQKFPSKNDQIIWYRVLCVEEKSLCDINIFLRVKKWFPIKNNHKRCHFWVIKLKALYLNLSFKFLMIGFWILRQNYEVKVPFWLDCKLQVMTQNLQLLFCFWSMNVNAFHYSFQSAFRLEHSYASNIVYWSPFVTVCMNISDRFLSISVPVFN